MEKRGIKCVAMHCALSSSGVGGGGGGTACRDTFLQVSSRARTLHDIWENGTFNDDEEEEEAHIATTISAVWAKKRLVGREGGGRSISEKMIAERARNIVIVVVTALFVQEQLCIA
jgi:hypothetical protein